MARFWARVKTSFSLLAAQLWVCTWIYELWYKQRVYKILLLVAVNFSALNTNAKSAGFHSPIILTDAVVKISHTYFCLRIEFQENNFRRLWIMISPRNSLIVCRGLSYALIACTMLCAWNLSGNRSCLVLCIFFMIMELTFLFSNRTICTQLGRFRTNRKLLLFADGI